MLTVSRFPVVAVGIIRWVESVVSDPMFFSLSTEYCPVHLALCDEVVSCHPLLHQRILDVSINIEVSASFKISCFGYCKCKIN